MKLRIFSAVLICACCLTSAAVATSEARASFKRGYEQLAAEQYYQAINSFKETLTERSYPLLDYSYYYIGQAYQESGYPEYADRVYRIVLDHYPDSVLGPKALFNLGKIAIEAGSYEAGSKVLREMLSRYPEHDSAPEARFLLGRALEELDQPTDAARVYRNLDLLHPESDFADQALEQLDQMAKSGKLAGYEAPAATLYNLGIKHFSRNNYTKAKEYFSRISRFYKKSSFYDEAVLMLGRIYLRQGKLKTAAQYFKQAINLDKDSKPQAMFYLALTYGYMDSPQACIQTLLKIPAMFSESPWADDALYHAGKYYRIEDKDDEALRVYARLIADYPRSEWFADSLWLVGNLYYKERNYEAAYQAFAKASDLPANQVSDQLLFWTAKAAEKIKRPDQAVAAYKQTIARYDHSYYGYRAREELAKYGIKLDPNTLPRTSESAPDMEQGLEACGHEEKYAELIALELGEEAAEEAAFIEEKVPLSKKDQARLAQYHAYVMKGNYAKPIWFADQKIEEATLSGSLSDLDPRLWRFAYPRGYGTYVEKYSEMYGVDPYLTYAVIREESRFKSRALSRSWAHGLMQIIPSTGRRISSALGFSYARWKMYEPRVNIWMGTYYLSSLIKRFDGNVPLALAGYNGGPVRVQQWLKQYDEFDLDEFVEDIPLRETRNYVKKVMKSYYGYKRTYGSGG
ncbi:MAG: transglycosylase SLT domain-containing protein [Candidatus Saganbacteria bacterium]|nr:transglycosylase SLT domain-containing protein [Candidatus Saganbacteria bacterium]